MAGEFPHHDLLIVGGGIDGAGIARDAAGRGLKVLLVEKDDLAVATSSSSSEDVLYRRPKAGLCLGPM